MSVDDRYWRDPALGERVELETSGGRMHANVAGDGEPIVFVHGALVNANLWRRVVAALASRFRCITLELPLGSHELPMPEADMSPPGLAELVVEACGGLELERPVLVGNDTGGALCQIALARHPDLAGGLVLTSCDAYDNFPPRFFRIVLWPGRFPAVARIGFAPLRLHALRKAPIAFGWLMRSKLDRRVGDSYVLPVLTGSGQGEDIARFLRAVDPRYTLEAAQRLRSYEHPVLIAWSRDDRFFPPEHAERLAAELPHARLEWIEDSLTFSPEDQPERLAGLIGELVSEARPAASPGGARASASGHGGSA